MKVIHTLYDRVTVIQIDGLIDPLRVLSLVALADQIGPSRRRDLVLAPREYEGRLVLAVYDRPTDTLYIRVSS